MQCTAGQARQAGQAGQAGQAVCPCRRVGTTRRAILERPFERYYQTSITTTTEAINEGESYQQVPGYLVSRPKPIARASGLLRNQIGACGSGHAA